MLRAVRTTLDGVTRPVLATARDAVTLATKRVGRLDQYVGTHRDRLDLDEARQPARARERLLLDPEPAARAQRAFSSPMPKRRKAAQEPGAACCADHAGWASEKFCLVCCNPRGQLLGVDQPGRECCGQGGRSGASPHSGGCAGGASGQVGNRRPGDPRSGGARYRDHPGRHRADHLCRGSGLCRQPAALLRGAQRGFADAGALSGDICRRERPHRRNRAKASARPCIERSTNRQPGRQGCARR